MTGTSGTWIECSKGEWGMTFKSKRNVLNLTQVQLAPLLGVSVKSIKNYEQGIREPSKSVLMLLDGLLRDHKKE